VSWSAIAQIETGRRVNLRPATLSALANALGLSIDYVVSGRAGTPRMLEHQALIYEADEEFVTVTAAFLREALDRSEPALVVTTTANRERLRKDLGPAANKIVFADRTSWYATPVTALTGYRAFLQSRLEAGADWVRAVGEPPWSGGDASELRRWSLYESLVNIAFGSDPLTLLCPYDARTVDAQIISQVRATHPHTVEREALSASEDYLDPAAFVLERSP
jgi:transcriptional regulator with XRE-family HTH domain